MNESPKSSLQAINSKRLAAEKLFSQADLVSEFQEACAPRQRALLSLLAVSQKHDLDPAPLIRSLANDLPRTPLESRRRTKKLFWNRVKQLSDEVEDEGNPLEKLKAFPRLLPGQVELALRLEEQNGTLGQLFGQWLNRPPQFNRDGNRVTTIVDTLIKAFLLFAFMTTIVSFFAIKVAPELLAMMEEFAIEPPWLLTFSIEVIELCVGFWFIPFLLFLLALPFGIQIFLSYFKRWNPFVWRQPSLPRQVRSRRALALLTDHGKNRYVPSALLGLKQVRRDVGVANKKGALPGVGHLTWGNLVKRNKISASDMAALEKTKSQATQAWILRKTADSTLRTREDWGRFLSRGALIGVNVVMGIVACMLAFSVFSTLITIMSGLSG